jgi:Ca2+-binding RTX toxin-like protein
MPIEGTEGRDVIRVDDSSETVYAYGGNDLIANQSDGATLVGGSGNDQYRLYKPNATIIEEEDGGHDTIWAWRSIDMPDNVEDVLFKGQSNWQVIRGNTMDNRIEAGAGTQAIKGGGGDDYLIGGADMDQFSFELGDGQDTIADFASGEDVITLWGLGIESMDDLTAVATETDTGVTFQFSAEQSLTLENVALADLSAEDFLLDFTPDDWLSSAVLTFEDTFDDETSLTDGTWNTSPSNGHPYTASTSRGERYHTYVDENSGSVDGTSYGLNPFSVTDGVLSITAERTPTELQDEISEEWISGVLETHGTFEQTYGYFEIRAKTPEGQGLWPAFWLVPADYSWPPEIDILESLGSATDVYRAAVHAEIWGTKVTAAQTWLVPEMSEDFHTYGMLWTPETVTFTFDGRVMLEVATPEDMHGPMSMRLNLAVGGWEGGPDDTTPDGQSFEIDYVRAYEIPGIETLSRSTDTSDYGDLENGALFINSVATLELYGDEVWRADDLGVDDLTLGETDAAALVGNAQDNVLTGNAQSTAFNGAGGNDLILAGAGDDYLIGGEGNDTLDGGQGEDTMVGGLGDDTYVVRAGDGSSTAAFDLIIEGPGEGFDTIFFADLNPNDIRSYIDWARWHIVVEDGSGTEYFAIKVTPGSGGHDLGTYIEQAVFADGTVWDLTSDLYLHGDDLANTNSGSVNNDTLLGAGGEDTLVGMDGDDHMDGGAGVDLLLGWNGADVLFDTGTEGGDRMFGEQGNDTITGGRGIDELFGGAGNDSLKASSDGDILNGGADGDFLKGIGGNDTLNGDAGADSMIGGGGNDSISGGADNDTIKGNAGDDILLGGAGGDNMIAGDGNDTLDGGAGRDFYRGNGGVDTFVLQFDEIDRDVIRDFQAGERVEIDIDGHVDDMQISISGRRITIEDQATGETATLFATGVATDDIFFV